MSGEDRGQVIIYQTEDGQSRIECHLVDETIWLSQGLLAELFDHSKKTISPSSAVTACEARIF